MNVGIAKKLLLILAVAVLSLSCTPDVYDYWAGLEQNEKDTSAVDGGTDGGTDSGVNNTQK